MIASSLSEIGAAARNARRGARETMNRARRRQSPSRPPRGDRSWKFCGGAPTSLSPGGRARPPSSLLPPASPDFSPLQGGGWEGGPALGAPASRRPRAKRERGCGPSARQAGGTPALPGGSRTGGIGKVPDRAAEPLGNPPPDLPLPGGRRRRPRGEERRRRGPPPCSAIESGPTGDPDSSPCPEGRSEDGPSSAIALGEVAGRSHLEFCGGAPASPSPGRRARGRHLTLLPPSGGRSGGGSRPWERRRPAGIARSANQDAGLQPAKPAGRRRSRAVHR